MSAGEQHLETVREGVHKRLSKELNCQQSLKLEITNIHFSYNSLPVLPVLSAKQYGVKDVVEGIEYEFRVSAINFSGAGEPSSPSEFVIARDPKSES